MATVRFMASHLKQWRLHFGLTQEETAKRTGTHKTQISKLESGLRRTTTDWLTKLAKAFGLADPGDLLRAPPVKKKVVLIPNRRLSGKPRVEIEYCTQCRSLLRAGWMAQELLSTFETELGGVMLIPGTGGIFEVRVEGETVWSRKAEGRFPDIAELKQRVRDKVAPERDLGHVDRHGAKE